MVYCEKKWERTETRNKIEGQEVNVRKTKKAPYKSSKFWWSGHVELLYGHKFRTNM